MRPQLDLNLLFIVESLYRTLNVSKTAHELHMSQSAVSHALARVRDHFGDQLFVRVSKGMAATELARQLKPSIEAFVQQAREVVQPAESFDPKKAKGRITIATTDMIEIVLMPRLLQRLKQEAPDIQMSIRPTNGDLPKAELESGVYDLAIAGFYKNLPEGFYQTKVLEQRFSTAFRKNHSVIHGALKADQYYECDHALITLQGDFKDGNKKTICGKRRERKFVFGSYSFTSLAWTLASTDLVLTAPTMLLNKYKEYFPIHVQEAPIDIPRIEIRMLWHALTHRDPLKAWFRKVLKEEFEALSQL
jgi:DNA-binding transcriptional LysR family regulator